MLRSHLLRDSAVYHRLKASLLYDMYWRVRDPRIIDERDSEVTFYRRLLDGMPRQALVFDVGANHGYKVDIFLRLGARVVAIDPDETNQAVLHDRFHALRWRERPVTIVGKAVSSECGFTSFWVDEPGGAKNTLSQKWVYALQHDLARFGTALSFAEERKVETVTLADLFVAHGSPYFVKIDVEGHELGVLRGMDRPVPFLSFEVNLPDFLEEGIECIRRLRELRAASRFNFAGPEIGEGLLLPEWVEAVSMIEALGATRWHSVEIFCRT